MTFDHSVQHVPESDADGDRERRRAPMARFVFDHQLLVHLVVGAALASSTFFGLLYLTEHF